MRMRSLLALTILFTCASTTIALADTVMVYVDISSAPAAGKGEKGVVDRSVAEEIQKDAGTLRAALEQGIMDEFYNAGHIIFNATPANVEGNMASSAKGLQTGGTSKWTSAETLAQRGGATRLIEVDLVYRSDEKDKKAVPVIARYSLWRLDTRAIVQSGTLEADSLSAGAKKGGGNMSLLMGETIATDLLNVWQ